MRGAEEGGPTRGCWHLYYCNAADKWEEKTIYRYVVKKNEKTLEVGRGGGGPGDPGGGDGKGSTLRLNPEDHGGR